MNGTKLFVGGLPWSMTDEELKDLFSEAGAVVDAVIIRDRNMNNRSKGFGFVEFEEADQAEKAIELFHEKEVGGRNIIVNLAKPREER